MDDNPYPPLLALVMIVVFCTMIYMATFGFTPYGT